MRIDIVARPPLEMMKNHGGTARVLSMAFTDPAEEQAVIAEFNAARDAEILESARWPYRLGGSAPASTTA